MEVEEIKEIDYSKPLDTVSEKIRELLEGQTETPLNLHNWEYTEVLVNRLEKLIKKVDLSEKEIISLKYAALFLNLGFLKNYDSPIGPTIREAEELLSNEGLPKEFIDLVKNNLSSVESRSPESLTGKIMHDLYYSFLGHKKNDTFLENWFLEENLNRTQAVDEYDWLRNKYRAFKKHRFLTDSAQARYDARKSKNITKIKKTLLSLRESESLSKNKAAQTVFKTTLRNQVDLISIADKKAGIMISINSILLTVMLPLMASYLIDLSQFMIPSIILVITCGISIILATMATRPGRFRGALKNDQIKGGERSLFFFGNFFEMAREDFQKAVRGTITRRKVLENSVINDIFDHGQTLGRMYNRLRMCYLVFASGIGLTLITVLISILMPMNF